MKRFSVGFLIGFLVSFILCNVFQHWMGDLGPLDFILLMIGGGIPH
jgi:hypothetical protein